MAGLPTKIIVVDDDDGHCELVARHLRRGGIGNPIAFMSSGATALDYVFGRANYADRVRGEDLLMLLDINMPGIGGIEVLRQIRSDPTIKGLVLVMLTTTGSPSEVDQCYRYGCDLYLTKSMEPSTLIEAVRCLLPALCPGDSASGDIVSTNSDPLKISPTGPLVPPQIARAAVRIAAKNSL